MIAVENRHIMNSASSDETEISKPHRYRLQFSLRTLLLAMTIFGGVICPIIYYRQEAERQLEFFLELRSLGVEPSGAVARRSNFMQWLFGNDTYEYITVVAVTNGKADDAIFKRIARLKHLEKVQIFNNSQISGDGIRELRNSPKLQELQFGNAPNMPDSLASHLRDLPHLKKLSIYGTTISYEGASCLGELKELERLEFINATISDAGFEQITKLGHLSSLTLNGQGATTPGKGFTDAWLLPLQKMPQLRSLALLSPMITDAGIKNIEALTQLRSLKITCTSVTNDSLASIAKLPQLEELNLLQADISDAGWEQLQALTNLKKLALNLWNSPDSKLAYLAKLEKLEALKMDCMRFSGAGLVHLQALPNLRRLDIYHSEVMTNDDLAFVGGLKGIEELTFFYVTPVTDAGLVHLKSLPKLRRLNICINSLTDAGLNHLKGIPQLKRLSWLNATFTVSGLKNFKRALPDCEVKNEHIFEL